MATLPHALALSSLLLFSAAWSIAQTAPGQPSAEERQRLQQLTREVCSTATSRGASTTAGTRIART